MEETKEKLLQWHPAFFAGIQIELKEEAKYLVFENEHNLSKKPMQIDVLIIKKNIKKKIKKNIGRIFRKHNIIEYKSPDDYLSIDDFYKVYGYTCFYKSEAEKVDEIKTEELTISYVCSHYPQKLIHHLTRKWNMAVERQSRGIYYIEDKWFQIQLIVTTELSSEENLWLKNLTNQLKGQKEVERLIHAYRGNENNELYQSVMDVIVRANEVEFKEANDNMCDALFEIMKDKLEEKLEEKLYEKEQEGEKKKLSELIRKKIVKGKSLAQIADELEETEEAILQLYNQLKEESNME